MAKKTKHLSVKEIENAYEVQILSKQFTQELDDEVHSVIGMLFFQTRSHIQLDVTNLNYIPLSFINQIIALARDLRAKKRVLVLVGVPYSTYHFLQRFQLTKLFFQLKDGMVKRKFQNPLRSKGEFLT
jgi:anti-anti-sigma regulatory factor